MTNLYIENNGALGMGSGNWMSATKVAEATGRTRWTNVGVPESFGECQQVIGTCWQAFRAFRDFVVPMHGPWSKMLTRGRKIRAGQLFAVRYPKAQKEVIVPPDLKGQDICTWCGCSNGPGGELRQGWDCQWCGSN
jgi:hypothetical protein